MPRGIRDSQGDVCRSASSRAAIAAASTTRAYNRVNVRAAPGAAPETNGLRPPGSHPPFPLPPPLCQRQGSARAAAPQPGLAPAPWPPVRPASRTRRSRPEVVAGERLGASEHRTSAHSSSRCTPASEKRVRRLNRGVRCLNRAVRKLNRGVRCLNRAVRRLNRGVRCLNRAVQRLTRSARWLDRARRLDRAAREAEPRRARAGPRRSGAELPRSDVAPARSVAAPTRSGAPAAAASAE